MRFRPGVRLDTSQINDRRGGVGGRMGLGPVAAGGGGLGLVAIIVIIALQMLGGSADTGGQTAGTQRQSVGNADLTSACRTGVDANQSTDCLAVATVNSVQAYWSSTLQGYREAPTTFFDGSVSTGCGSAFSATGPFYCPGDQTVYIDLGFYDDLRTTFGANGGPFAQAYVLAHEYGHHVQHLLGLDRQVTADPNGPQSGLVRLELQADCFAGAWAANAEATGFIEPLTRTDIVDGLDAAAAIGDDRIQRMQGGGVDPEAFTHGTSSQRQAWWSAGYRSGDPRVCDTWSAASLDRAPTL